MGHAGTGPRGSLVLQSRAAGGSHAFPAAVPGRRHSPDAGPGGFGEVPGRSAQPWLVLCQFREQRHTAHTLTVSHTA